MTDFREKKASDITKEQCDDIYRELFKLGEGEQKAYAARGKKRPFVSESQKKLELFTRDMLSVGEALDYIKAQKVAK